jgi:hypothetical protein
MTRNSGKWKVIDEREPMAPKRGPATLKWGPVPREAWADDSEMRAARSQTWAAGSEARDDRSATRADDSEFEAGGSNM